MSYNLNLRLPGLPDLLPLVTRFSELGARSLGLGHEEALALTLATEEIFMNLSSFGLPTEWELVDGAYCVNLRVSFPKQQLDLVNLNLVAKIDLEDEQASSQLGWLLAAKSVDRFQVEHDSPDKTTFVLTKKRFYPEVEACKSWPKPGTLVSEIRQPTEQELILFCQRTVKSHDPKNLMGLIRRPGRLWDMVRSKEAIIRVGFSAQGEPLGGAVLHFQFDRAATLHGPYVFDQPYDLERRLFHELLKAVAKSPLEGIIAKDTEALFQDGEVEFLGQRTLQMEDGTRDVQRLFYRHLTEDEGSVIWSAPELQTFLEREYDRLDLAREVELWHPSTRPSTVHSVLSSDIRRDQRLVILRPILEGSDVVENILAHIEQLRRDDLRNIFCHLDLGQTWQMSFAKPLLDCGFEPRFVIPGAENGDSLLLQLPLGDEV